MPPAEPVLIVALSGRQLAVSARRNGFVPLVVDAFGDLDMVAAAAGHATVPLTDAGRFDTPSLLAAAQSLAPSPVPLVWGAGLEAAPELLATLADGREILGNDEAAVQRAKEPRAFAWTLAGLGVPHPEIRVEPPADLADWVARTTGGSGGAHVRPSSLKGDHWQRLSPGTPVSALVAADGVSARMLGFSEQWVAGTKEAPFRWGGASAPATPALAAPMAAAAARVVAALRLRGLVSVDMLAEPVGFVVLEVNPRPGGALEVYEAAFGHSLFGLHVAACRGRMPDQACHPRRHAAAALVWAERPCRLPTDWRWPSWTADRGRPGTLIPRGAPVCTVRAVAPDAATARRRCARRIALVRERLVISRAAVG